MRLLEPLTLGQHTLRNRVLFGPHETNLGRDRSFSDRHIAYYRRRAAGGTAVIVTEEASVHPLDWPYERCPLANACAPGWADISASCHAEGALVVAALGHSGLQGSSAYSQRETWAPSRVPDTVTRELPKEMEADDIDAVLDGFATSAAIAVDSGCDGVELNAGQHSLIRQFLSGLSNSRSDQWGPGDDGSGRHRFAVAALEKVRASIGAHRLLGVRLSCDELAPWAGLTPEMAADVAATLAPLVDYLVVVRGSLFTVDATRPDAHTEPGFNLEVARLVRDRVAGTTTVVAQGSIVEWGQAEWAIADGCADMVEMTRAQIADPDLATKLTGDPATIRPCILCNQRCRVRDARNPIVTCTVNPSAGHEDTEPEAAEPVGDHLARPVTIVGAGPAGLECARVAAEAGHRVELIDRRDTTGGVVRDWTAASGRNRLVQIVDWLEAECRRVGVTIRLGRTVAPTDVEDCSGDGETVVILCTGSRAAPTSCHTDALTLLATGCDDPRQLPEGTAVVWDPTGGPIGVSVAESLAAHRPVVFVTPDVIPGTLLSLTGDLAAASTRMLQAGIEIRKRQVLSEVRPTEVELEDRFTGERSVVPAALVVDCGHRQADDQLWRSSGEHLPRAGDAVAPRTIHEAILEGRRLARRIGGDL